MKHKHYEMIVTKAANMDLVVFSKNESKWRVSTFEDIVCWPFHEHFLCLPQHKEACLHWLNGGDVQQSPLDVEQWVTSGNNRSWMVRHSFMQDKLKFRIKPRKEKRWIAVKGEVTSCLYDTRRELELMYANTSGVQFIEIEIEV